MLKRLTLDTSAHHAAADEERLALLSSTTCADYAAYLAHTLGFEARVEEALSRVHALEHDLVMRRNRIPLLRRDLMALGVSSGAIEQLPRARPVRIDTLAQALGWLFVIERTALFAGLVRRHLERTLGPDVHGAVGYLASYGERPGMRQRMLGETLERHVARASPEAIVIAAHDAFRAQRNWFVTRDRSIGAHLLGHRTSQRALAG